MPEAPHLVSIVIHLAPPAWLGFSNIQPLQMFDRKLKKIFYTSLKIKDFSHSARFSLNIVHGQLLIVMLHMCCYIMKYTARILLHDQIIIAACVKTWPHHNILIEAFSVHSRLFDCQSRNRFGSDGSFPTNVPVSHDSEPAWTIPRPCNYLNYTAQLFFGAISYTCASPAMKHLLWKKAKKCSLANTCTFMWLSSQIIMWRYYNG